MDTVTPKTDKRKSKFHPFTRQKQSLGPTVVEPDQPRTSLEKRSRKSGQHTVFSSLRRGKTSDGLDGLSRNLKPTSEHELAPPTNGDATSEHLAPPSSRLSQSSQRSFRTSQDHTRRAPSPTSFHPTTRPSPTRTKTALSWIPKKHKNRQSLFPLPVKIPQPDGQYPALSSPRGSSAAIHTSADHSPGTETTLDASSPPRNTIQRSLTANEVLDRSPSLHQTSSSIALAASSISFAAPGTSLLRKHSSASTRSSPAATMKDRFRNRSSTVGSTGARSEDVPPTPPVPSGASGRNSTSTAGRSSFTNLFGLGNRFRHSSEPHSPRHGSPGRANTGTPGPDSHSNSLNLPRETPTLPEREEGESPVKYLERIEEVVVRSSIPALLCKINDKFSESVMRSYMRKFAFFGDPLDMSMRKLLMHVDLPKETQHIDRVIQSFADRYDECNPGIFTNPGTDPPHSKLTYNTNHIRNGLFYRVLHSGAANGYLQQEQQTEDDTTRLHQEYAIRKPHVR